MTRKTEINVNEVLPPELLKQVIKQSKRRKVYWGFKDNGKAQDSAEMGLLSSKNRGVKYLLSVIDVFIKQVYAIYQINYGLIKKWVDQMYSTHTEGKSVVTERLIRTWKGMKPIKNDN